MGCLSRLLVGPGWALQPYQGRGDIVAQIRGSDLLTIGRPGCCGM